MFYKLSENLFTVHVGTFFASENIKIGGSCANNGTGFGPAPWSAHELWLCLKSWIFWHLPTSRFQMFLINYATQKNSEISCSITNYLVTFHLPKFIYLKFGVYISRSQNFQTLKFLNPNVWEKSGFRWYF